MSVQRKKPITDALAPLRAASRARSTEVVVGVMQLDGMVRRNLTAARPADGGAPAVYVKEHDQVAVPGHALRVTSTAGVPVGLANCDDVNFPN